MAVEESGSSLLLALPDPCLLAVLQYCADNDQHSLLSAARAHSRLHQAAVLALRNITALVTGQEQVDSALLYLGKHGQHVDSVSIEYTGDEDCTPSISFGLHPVVTSAQLHSWQLYGIVLEGNGLQGVLGPTLTQLRLEECSVCGDAAVGALEAALSQLPDLQHLSLRSLGTTRDFTEWYQFPAGVLQQLQHLTFLELHDIEYSAVYRPFLQPLQALTRLEDLRVKEMHLGPEYISITASMLSGAHHLTRLQLVQYMEVEPAVLAGKTRLQHLQIVRCTLVGAVRHTADPAQLLSHLQRLQQLTHLDLTGSFWDRVEEDNPPAAAYAALTASSRLQHLNISECELPAGAWQHMFPAGRQLPHLRKLVIQELGQASGGGWVAAPEGSRLVSCCPALQSLIMPVVQHSAQLLAALQGLSGLHNLYWGDWVSAREGMQLVCQLTGLRKLDVDLPYDFEEWRVLQLTQLKQLTALECCATERSWSAYSAPGDEPVWRQLLQLFLDNSSDPDVLEEAAAGLAE